MNRNTNKNETRTLTNFHKAMFAALLAQLAGTSVSLGQAETPAGNHVTTPTPVAVPETRALPVDAGQPTDPNAPAPAGQPKLGNDKVSVDENNIVDLHVNDEELSNVLEMLSLQSQQNIVASKAVSARVTANLYGVTFWEALDAILNVNGFGYIKQGNFIYVYTNAELEVIAKAQRQKVHKVINLNYLNATDAAEFVKPLLSETGQIKTNGKTVVFPTPGATPLGADEYANSSTLVVIDFEDNINEIENLVKQLDTRPAQVLVEATILQTTLTEANAFGVDFSIIADMDFGDFVKLGGPLSAINNLIGGATDATRNTPLPTDGKGGGVSSTVGNTAGPGGIKLGIVKNDVAVFMRILDEVSDTTILSNPKILALNRQPSRVLVGRKVGYLSTTSTDTATTQTVEFLDTGTQLTVRPFITNDGMVRMELKPQVSEAVIRDTNDSNGQAVTIPDEITNELVTNVLLGDGQTVVLGGLFRESTTSARRQIPFLGDIPIVGQAFRGNDDNTNRNEIIFLVTPTIVNDTTMTLAGQRGKDYVEHIRAGSREGLLFWSREKLTSKMNVEAERLAEAGDTEKALWKINRSLSLNHNQPEAVALRERLTGHRAQWPSRSYIEKVLHGDAQKAAARHSDAGNAESPDLSSTNFNNAAPAPAKKDVPQDDPMVEEAHSGVSNTPANASNSFNTNDSTPAVEPTESQPASPESPSNASENLSTPEMPEAPISDVTAPVTPEAPVSDFSTPASSESSESHLTSPESTPSDDSDSSLSPDSTEAMFPITTDEVGSNDGTHSGESLDGTSSVVLPEGFESNNTGLVPSEHAAPVSGSNTASANVADAKDHPKATEVGQLWLGRAGFRGGAWSFFKALASHYQSVSDTLTEVQDDGHIDGQ